MSPPIRRPGWLAAALIALLMLGYASVRSTVMQAAMAAPAGAAMPMCDGGVAMTGMATPSGDRATPGKPAPAASKNCPYCAAAAHPPLATQAVGLRPCATAAFVAYRVAPPTGPRGPPSRDPRARAPPLPRPSA